MEYLSDFKHTLEQLEKLARHGATKPGRYRCQWREDRDPMYHCMKAMGHLQQATKQYPTLKDPEHGGSHLINTILRLMIANEQEQVNEN